MLIANIRDLTFQRRDVKGKRLGNLRKRKLVSFEDEELKSCFKAWLKALTRTLVTNEKRAWTKMWHTPQGSEHDDDGIDDAQRALLNVDIVVGDWATNEPPTFLPLDDSAAGVQHSMFTRCR
ncbi:hypothetical protein KIN20_023923 [Parelaphostrongylus tenuis]|uniref:Uncharacterized protein n=1 Tax=Parelaphostrongylus tenuis TaxID=148309 RepID=A0AAD5QXI1_PARTN|nr:hypothetical protein KIN20_023923 [Parelaphostrongylus tenuis]